jgi:hypothetical protein
LLAALQLALFAIFDPALRTLLRLWHADWRKSWPVRARLVPKA